VLADATMVLHFTFLVYVVVGGFLAWRWPWTIVTHLAAATWGVLIIARNLTCPLTPLEDYFRKRAGEEGLSGGFIDTYLTGVVYPEEHVDVVRALVAIVVAVSWAGLVVRRRRQRARAHSAMSA
jgi:Protein of Unknown function (DUF2784).